MGRVVAVPRNHIPLRCPVCSAIGVAVLDSRVKRGGSIRRRRACNACGHRYFTIEITEEAFRGLIQADTLDRQRQVIGRATRLLQSLLSGDVSALPKDTSHNPTD